MGSSDDGSGAAVRTVTETETAAGVPDEPGEPRDPLGRGESIGRYVILERLGEGGMGVVFRAYDPELDRSVALKLIHPGDAGTVRGARLATRLLREAQAMARLSHPNVVTVHELGTYDDQVFVAMEFVDGEPLDAWLRGARRDWPDVLAVFVQAGRGLAAAHAAGIVHRDFKPGNVLVGQDGRARVLDFGLARALDAPDTESAESLDPDRAPVELDTPLTRTGAIMGTPAYMASEQHLGQATDARTDQFAFCVALFEGLYGERPYRGQTRAAIAEAVLQGTVEVPRDGKVPPKIRRALLRGLSPQPEDRFPDMSSLLAALAVGGSRRLLWPLLAVGFAGLAGAAALRGDETPVSPPVCQGARAEVEPVWSAERAASISKAFAATGAPSAEFAASRVVERLDDYARRWAQTHTEACEATRVNASQSEQVLDLRMACLGRARTQLRVLVELFEEPDAKLVERSVSAASGLSRLDACSDVERLLASVPPPQDPHTAQAVEASRDQMAEIGALKLAGKLDDALALAQALDQEAASLDYTPLRAETLEQVGTMLDLVGRYPDAEDHLRRAYFLALRNRHDSVLAHSSAQLVHVVGYQQRRYDDGLEWFEHAQAALQLVGSGGEEAELLYTNVAGIYWVTDDKALAREYQEKSLAIAIDLYGVDGHGVARAHSNLGQLYLSEGDPQTAADHQRKAIEIFGRTVGPDHPFVLYPTVNLSLAQAALGESEAALDTRKRALELALKIHGDDHQNTALVRGNLAESYLELERYDEAREQIARAREGFVETLGPEHQRVAFADVRQSVIETHAGNPSLGLEYSERGLALYEKTSAPDSGALGDPLCARAEALIALGRHGEAVHDLQRALALRLEYDAGLAVLPHTRFLLAKALAPADAERSEAEAQEALEEANAVRGAERLARRIRAWLAERG